MTAERSDRRRELHIISIECTLLVLLLLPYPHISLFPFTPYLLYRVFILCIVLSVRG